MLFLVALAIAVLSERAGYYGLLVLLLSGPVTHVLDRLTRRRRGTAAAPPTNGRGRG